MFVNVSMKKGIARAELTRGKVNAINEAVVDELMNRFQAFSDDPAVKAVILTGRGKFFTFGFDIPEFLGYGREDFIRYLTKFTDLYTFLFLFPKPLIAALNGHTIAGGCMIALSCDRRIMVSGKSRISLNEINFGASLFAGSVEMMRFHVGSRRGERAILSGGMYSPEEALALGLVDQVVAEADQEESATTTALEMASKDPVAFKSIKLLSRKDVADLMKRKEKASILEFVDIWYSESTWSQLQDKKIY